MLLKAECTQLARAQDFPYRKKQLELYRQLVEGCPRVILCGDTNFTRSAEDAALGERFADAWPAVHHATDEGKKQLRGNTFDSSTNKMCRAQVAVPKSCNCCSSRHRLHVFAGQFRVHAH